MERDAEAAAAASVRESVRRCFEEGLRGRRDFSVDALLRMCVERPGGLTCDQASAVAAGLVHDLGLDAVGPEVRVDYEKFLGWLYADAPEQSTPLQHQSPRGHPQFSDLLSEGAGCEIPKTEERGIRLVQLRALLAHVARRLGPETWCDFSGGLLTADTADLYAVVNHVVRPSTEQRRCSYVEAVAQGPQPPRWFVSHWWGEPVADFVSCLEKHASDRQLGPSATYWVCAYANNQWEASAEVGVDPAQSSFSRAIGLSQGTVSVVDSGARCFGRVWCCFEVWISLLAAPASTGEDKYLYDMYTVAPSGAVGLTDGFAEVDMRRDVEFWKDDKYEREQSFPIQLAQHALSVELQRASASEDMDRRRILNSIISAADLEGVPPQQHQRYDELNNVLRGRFAIALWRRALEVGEAMDLHTAALARSSVRDLKLSFDGCKAFTHQAFSLLVRALPATLKELDLDITECRDIRDEDVSLLAERLPTALQALSLRVQDCVKLTDDSVKALAASMPSSLQSLELRFNRCHQITDEGLASLAAGMPRTVRDLSLSFFHCTNLTDAGVKSLAGGFPSGLRHLTLNLVSCYKIRDPGIEVLLRACPDALEGLKLWLTNCVMLTDVCLEALASRKFRALQGFTLYLGYCKQLTDKAVEHVSGSLPSSLRGLQLDLSVCERLGDGSLRALGARLPRGLELLDVHLSQLQCITDDGLVALVAALPDSLLDLVVNADECKKLSDVGLQGLAARLPQTLQRLKLSLCDTKKITDDGIRSVGASLPASLQRLKLVLCGAGKVTDGGLRALGEVVPATLHTLILDVDGCQQVSQEGLRALKEQLAAQSIVLQLMR